MQIRIEIDVKPEELRRFLGLPDVVGLQEDLINFLRDKLGSAAETLDPSTFVKENLETLKASAPWQLVVQATKTSARFAGSTGKSSARRIAKVASAAVAAVAGGESAAEPEAAPAIVRTRKARGSRRKAGATAAASPGAKRKSRRKPAAKPAGSEPDPG